MLNGSQRTLTMFVGVVTLLHNHHCNALCIVVNKVPQLPQTQPVFSRVRHKQDDSVASLDYAHAHMSTMYFRTRLLKNTHQHIVQQHYN